MNRILRLSLIVTFCALIAPRAVTAREKEDVVYRAGDAVLQRMSAQQAIETVKAMLGGIWGRNTEVRIDKMTITVIYGKKRESKEFAIPDIMPELVLYENKTGDGLIFGDTYRTFRIPGIGSLGDSKHQETWQELVDALFVLKAGTRIETDPQYQRQFSEVVRKYRSAVIKPDLPEEARRYKVQAEARVRQKDFAQARSLYQSALEVAPWWPDGHFNLALQLAEAGEFAAAIVEMKRYLQLAPEAPDARAAQDKIYEWELETPAAARPARPAQPARQSKG